MCRLAVCLAGCEDVVVVDILSFLKDKHHDVSATCSVLSYSSIQTEASAEINGKKLYRGDTGCGKIIVTTIISPSVIVNAIRSVQYWFAYLSFSDKLPISTKKTDTEKTHDDELNHVTDLLRDADWTTALKTWSEFTGLDPEAKNITFCGRAIRNGTHSFSSQDIAMKIGEGVLTKQPHWKVNLTEMVSEIIAVVLNETLLLGIHLRHPDHKAFAKSKFPTEVRKPVLSLTSSSSGSMSPSLRPSSAYVILSLLEARPNELMVDATCSFGTCLVEASYGYGCVAIGGDCDIGLTEQQRNNAKSSMETARCHGHRIPAMMEILLWGASHLPIRDAIVDLLFVEIPWSKSKSDRPKYCNRMKIPKVTRKTVHLSTVILSLSYDLLLFFARLPKKWHVYFVLPLAVVVG